jgi:hypothetical protein
MPIEHRQARPPHEHPELVEALRNELSNETADGPRIIEEEQTYGHRLHVTVIWDRWAGVPHPERGPIILDAYREVRGVQVMLLITQPQGFTNDEARRHVPNIGDAQ